MRSAPTDADQTLKTTLYHFRESGLKRKQSALVQTLQKQTKLHPDPLRQPYTQSIFAQFLSKATCYERTSYRSKMKNEAGFFSLKKKTTQKQIGRTNTEGSEGPT